MRKKVFTFSIFMLSAILLVSFAFPSINVNATTNKEFKDSGTPNELGVKMSKDISQLDENEATREIDYIINNVFVYDDNGYVIDVNEQKSIDRYGYVPKEIKEMKSAVDYQKELQAENGNIATRSADYQTSNQCFAGEMKKNFADLIPTGTIGAIIEDGAAGKLTKDTVAKVLKAAGKSAVKGSVYGIAAQIIWTNEKCNWNYPAVKG
ncbi:hypothetical protein EKQ61_04430 [Staphylococcus gallinarum]|uniref:Uncharacterized protein n=1 Tax=Staphylococcus gallinarum TaxID=1293 RepID=A0A0D0SNV3_STAGA|nr:hypothetical protein [Staphylococcus gallinarum]KIR10894.1 hypothetical protein SH09_10605 [Staphylococcus gallinarum]RTX80310.1 hypothetical protein EKQ61_04430 [Staphylococcus gallinarum]GEQ06604.1 hypothetical protein SGA02_24320 [Staphylococcus gallinarum]SUQ38595.1 Uncharacterised protein [Staphylococcus gallinarum]